MDHFIKQKDPFISVVMSVYNGEKYLRDAIDSVLNQTFRDFEFIIINDGSTDQSLSIIKTFDDKRIVLINNEGNKGLIFSLNKGIEQAKGKYIARMDADDICLPERFSQQFNFLELHPEIGVCSSNYIQFNNSFQKTYSSFTDHDEIFAFLLFNSSIIHPSLLIRKNILINNHLFDDKYKHTEDYELWSRLIFECKFSSVPETLLKYRIHSNQVTNVYHSTQIEMANVIRRKLLIRCGFVFSEEEFRVHCLIGSSQLFKSKADLELLLSWFHHMIAQNNTLQVINSDCLIKALNKQWYDACGMTNLGITAFLMYLTSNFKSKFSGGLTKLFVKCIVRFFR